MKFLIMGAGALGSAFGGMLANAGYDVTLIGREKHMKPIREHGLRISGIWGAVGSSVESNAHGADENVRIRDLKDYVRFLVGLLV